MDADAVGCGRRDDPTRCGRCETCREPCPVLAEDGRPCGETKTLDIVKEFRTLYERKMREVESAGGGDNVQAKLNLQQHWIQDLTEQNEMLVSIVEELEQEATERIRLLEDKLKKTATAEREVMEKYSELGELFNVTDALQKTAYLRSDVKNLLEFVRRVREESSWDTEGLQFYEVNCYDLLGCCYKDKALATNKIREKVQKTDDSKDEEVASLQGQLQRLSKHGDIDAISKKLDETEELKKSMMEMRDALTTEVAQKHDQIITLKHELNQLEEQCRQINKHAQFKDDIIKELRKEIKQLKQQKQRENENLNEELRRKSEVLEKQVEEINSQLEATKGDLRKAKLEGEEHLKEKETYQRIHRDSLKMFEGMTADIAKEKEELERKHRESLQQIEALRAENERTREAMESTKRSSKAALENLEKAMMQDKNRGDTLERVSTLHLQMDKLRDDLRASGHRISFLTEENKKLQQTIAELSEKSKGPCKCDAGTNPRKKKTETGGTSPEAADIRDKGVQFEGEVGSQKTICELEEELASVNSKMKLIWNKDEIIRVQNDTLNIVQIELQALRSKESIIEQERMKGKQEIANLKQTIQELEGAVKSCKCRGDNLQKAVDLYLNSIKILEEAELKAQTEIQQQRVTITNLQEALIATKQELEDLRQRSSQEWVQLGQLIDHLHDTILDLEVENVDCLRDILMLESRLLKYQCHFSLNEDCICPLKAELKKLSLEKFQYEKMIQYLKEEMELLAEQLANLQDILSASNTNTIEGNVQMMQTIGQLQAAERQLQSELAAEIELNQQNTSQIKELQAALDAKDAEMEELRSSFAEKEANFEATIAQVTEQQRYIEQLQDNLVMFEHQTATFKASYEAARSTCKCKEGVAELKAKLVDMKAAVREKTAEVAKLKEKFAEREKMLDQATCECDKAREEAEEMRKTIRNLKEQLKTNSSKADDKTDQTLRQKLEKSEAKVKSLSEQVTKLEKELASVREQLSTKEEQLAHAETTIEQLSTTCKAAGELTNLKEEMQQAQSLLKAENEKLKAQVTRLKGNVSAYQVQSNSASEQLEQCLLEMQALQADKDVAEQKNEQLVVELQSMQNAFANLNRECFVKAKELHDTKSSKNQVCAESRNIIETIRSWLQEQKRLNDKLSEKMRAKNFLIQQLRRQKDQAMQKLLYYEKSCELQIVPSKLQRAYAASTNDTSHWSSVSRGGTSSMGVSSGTESATSSLQDWNYSDVDNDLTPETWVHRVESMTEDLQRSNEYWQNKMIVSDYIVRRDE